MKTTPIDNKVSHDTGDSFSEAILQKLKQFSVRKKGYFKHRI